MENPGKSNKPRLIAFYLPQFHPIPENDEWWGKGFTEWTNVAKATPLFRGHNQPRIPADLGFYDLRVPEVREEQARMAKAAGVEGFCYWHYWFSGKRLLDRPFNEVLQSGNPDFPFCVAWANESWSGVWHGNPDKILIKQNYPGIEDYKKHFYTLLSAFHDERYIRVNGHPLFYVYKPLEIPDVEVFMDCWRELAVRNGLKDFHFVGPSFDEDQAQRILNLGFNGVHTHWQKRFMLKRHFMKTGWNKVTDMLLGSRFKMPVWDYNELITMLSNELDQRADYYPNILSGWDNSPRSGKRGNIYINYNPDSFRMHVKDVVEKTVNKEAETNLVFLQSWNEWAEGNYVEPDLKYGWGYLNVLKHFFGTYGEK